jgi:hypothetical protein
MVVGTGSSLKKAGTGTIDASGIDADGDGTKEISVVAGVMSFDPNDDGNPAEMVLNANAQLVLTYPGYGYPFGEVFKIVVTGQSLILGQSGAGGRGTMTSTNQLSLMGANGAATIELGEGGATTIELSDRVLYGPSTATCADSGDGSPGALTITPTTSNVRVTNSDPHGCTLTLSETGAVDGQGVELELSSSAGGTVTLSDTAGAHNLAGDWTPGVGDSVTLRYNAVASEWRERGRADI